VEDLVMAEFLFVLGLVVPPAVVVCSAAALTIRSRDSQRIAGSVAPSHAGAPRAAH
jgi:hypothetical protein